MNEQDQDRLKAKMRGQSVVSIDAYRAVAQTTPNTGTQYLDPVTSRWIAIAVFVIALFLFIFRAV